MCLSSRVVLFGILQKQYKEVRRFNSPIQDSAHHLGLLEDDASLHALESSLDPCPPRLETIEL